MLAIFANASEADMKNAIALVLAYLEGAGVSLPPLPPLTEEEFYERFGDLCFDLCPMFIELVQRELARREEAMH